MGDALRQSNIVMAVTLSNCNLGDRGATCDDAVSVVLNSFISE